MSENLRAKVEELQQRLISRELEETTITLRENELWEFCKKVAQLESEHVKALRRIKEIEDINSRHVGRMIDNGARADFLQGCILRLAKGETGHDEARKFFRQPTDYLADELKELGEIVTLHHEYPDVPYSEDE